MNEIEVLKARLQALAAEYKAIKFGTFVAATAEKVVSDFKIALKVVQPFLDKILAIAKNKAGELSAEQANAAKSVFVAAPVFMANIAKIVIADSQKLVVSQLTKVAESVGYVAESMGLIAGNGEAELLPLPTELEKCYAAIACLLRADELNAMAFLNRLIKYDLS